MRVALRDRLSSLLPRGPLDLVRQIAIVSLFDIAYELSRVVATGDRGAAFAHARSVVGTERSLGIFRELSVQRFALHAPGIVLDVANWTYFNAQFTVTFAFLLWAYLRHTDRYTTIRNTVIAADAIGLIGYLGYPTAPPRMLPRLGFTDTLNQAAVNHHSGAIASLANPYAAMPSLHTAYALTFRRLRGRSRPAVVDPRHVGALPRPRRLLDHRHREPLRARRGGRRGGRRPRRHAHDGRAPARDPDGPAPDGAGASARPRVRLRG
jgi:PAP2 superfamily protein